MASTLDLETSFNELALFSLNLGQTYMGLTLDLETKFLKVLNAFYPNTSKVRFVKGLANYIK